VHLVGVGSRVLADALSPGAIGGQGENAPHREASEWGTIVGDPVYNFDGYETVDAGDLAEIPVRWCLACPAS
jgi:hypothetical protein